MVWRWLVPFFIELNGGLGMRNRNSSDGDSIVRQEYEQDAHTTLQPSTKPPWNPSVFYPLAILCGVAAVGILAGINYRRLGKPNLRWPTISTSVLIFVAVIVGIRVTDTSIEVVMWLPWLVNLLAALVLERLQRAHYKRWKESATIAKGAGWGVPVVVGLGGIAVIVVAFSVVIVPGLEEDYTRRILEAGITPIVIGQDITGTIDSDDYWDVFSFQAEQGNCYVIETGTPSTSTPLKDSFLTLWRPNPLLPLTENDDYGGSLNSRIEWTAEATGILWVTVESADSVSTGEYTLVIECARR